MVTVGCGERAVSTVRPPERETKESLSFLNNATYRMPSDIYIGKIITVNE